MYDYSPFILFFYKLYSFNDEGNLEGVWKLRINSSKFPDTILGGYLYKFRYILFFLLLFTGVYGQRCIVFTPPEGWQLLDTKLLSPRIKVMIVGSGKNNFYPPSINLGYEEYAGSLSDYLKEVKSVNQKTGAAWTDLGTIQTMAGQASLSQVDLKTEWGDVRMMHVMLIEDKILYVLTAASLKDEFSSFLPIMLPAMQSLRFQ